MRVAYKKKRNKNVKSEETKEQKVARLLRLLPGHVWVVTDKLKSQLPEPNDPNRQRGLPASKECLSSSTKTNKRAKKNSGKRNANAPKPNRNRTITSIDQNQGGNQGVSVSSALSFLEESRKRLCACVCVCVGRGVGEKGHREERYDSKAGASRKTRQSDVRAKTPGGMARKHTHTLTSKGKWGRRRRRNSVWKG